MCLGEAMDRQECLSHFGATIVKPAPLIIAFGILAVLVALVWYTEENPPETGEQKPEIISVEEDDIVRVTISRPRKDTITLQRGEDGEWHFGEPYTFPVGESPVNTMISNLASMNADRLVDEQVRNWAPYGLDGAGELEVSAVVKQEQPGDDKEGEKEAEEEEAAQKTYRVIFGNDTPTGGGVYARLEGESRLFTVFSYVKGGFEKEIFDLRDKKLLQVEEDKISRVTVNVGRRSIEFGKSGDDRWQILRPKPMRADNFTVGDLVRSVRTAGMVSVLEEGGEPSRKYRFRRPFAIAEIVDEAGAHTLTIAKSNDDSYYAKSSDLGGVYEVSSTMAEGLDKPLEDFRNKKLFDFGFKEIAALALRDGDTRLRVEKKDNKWVLSSEGDRELDSEKVQTVIDSLRSLAATGFPSDDAADQSKYGLDQPAIEAEVTVADGESSEKVLITEAANDRVYAAREGQPTTYEVEKSAAEEIQRAIQELPREEDESEGEGAEPEEDSEG